MDAYIPTSADVDVCLRTHDSATDVFGAEWTLLTPDGDPPAKRPFVPNPKAQLPLDAFSYTYGGVDGFAESDGKDFNQFQIKICMRSYNTCEVPIIDNIRAVSLLRSTSKLRVTTTCTRTRIQG